MPSQGAARLRSKENPPPRRFGRQSVLQLLQSCKAYLLLELLNILEPRKTSHQ